MEIRECKLCGKLFKPKYKANVFCSKHCSVTYNNIGRKHSPETKEKIRKWAIKKRRAGKDGFVKTSVLPNVSPKESRSVQKQDRQIISTCCECGRAFRAANKNVKFCSAKCSSTNRHKEAYQDFLENNEKYCRGNYTPKAFKNEFLKEQGNICLICGSPPMHNNKPLTFVLDHIDGDASNNKRTNLRMICPNCDSQLDTFKSKNKHSTRRDYWREHLIRQVKEAMNNGEDLA
jgi:hypothetical protein